MSELKFRAWDVDHYIENCMVVGGDAIIEFDEGNGFYEITSVDCVEQYTGLKDKNGKEIYEGDVLMTCIGLAKVFYDYEYCMWKIFAKHGTTMPLVSKKSRRHLDYEVIGNIHENKELLK